MKKKNQTPCVEFDQVRQINENWMRAFNNQYTPAWSHLKWT